MTTLIELLHTAAISHIAVDTVVQWAAEGREPAEGWSPSACKLWRALHRSSRTLERLQVIRPAGMGRSLDD